MDKTKKRFFLSSLVCAVSLSSVSLLTTLKGQSNVSDPIPQQGGLEITPISGIRFDSVRYVQNTDNIQKIVHYTLTPSTLQNVSFDTVLDFIHTDDEEWDWTYDSSRKPEDYMKVDCDFLNQDIMFTCYQPFGTRMFFDMVYPDNPSVSIRLILDYERKVITDYKTEISDTMFRDGSALKVLGTSAVYSIGTKGRRQDDITYDIGFQEGGGTLVSLLGKASNPSSYSPSLYRYQGSNYNSNTILPKMAEEVDQYLLSCITQDGSVTFETSKLKELLSFDYITYHDYMDHYGTSSAYFRTFITNYKANFKKGYGYQATISVNGDDVTTQKFDFEELPVMLENINIDDVNVTF